MTELFSAWTLPPAEQFPTLYADAVEWYQVERIRLKLFAAYARHRLSPYDALRALLRDLPNPDRGEYVYALKLLITARIVEHFNLDGLDPRAAVSKIAELKPGGYRARVQEASERLGLSA
jgi:hypothetical protein